MLKDGLWMLVLRKGQAFIPTMAQTEAGFYVGIEPVEVVDLSDRKGVPVNPGIRPAQENSESALVGLFAQPPKVLGAYGVNQRAATVRRKIFGSSGRIRTYNPSVNSRMLYH